jgi:hypothetical protein
LRNQFKDKKYFKDIFDVFSRIYIHKQRIQPGMTISSKLNNKKAGEVNNKKGKKLNQIIKIIQ